MSEAKQAGFTMQRSRVGMSADAVGPFTPVVFEHYRFIGGEHGVMLGYPMATATGRACMCWTYKATGAST